jgi:small-conductance mechanosensitive channel
LFKNWFDTHQITLAGARVSYAALIGAVIALILGFVLASVVAERIRGTADARMQGARWRTTVAKVVSYSLRIVAVSFALQITGINVGNILAAGAVLAVGIGIAMQKVAENFVSGVILLVERSIREDDIIELEGHLARIRQVGIRATIAHTLDDEEIVVPNSVLAQSTVKNYTLTDTIFRLRVAIGIDYGADLDHVMGALKKTAEAIPWRDPDYEPVVLLKDFGSSSIDFDVSVWTRDVWASRRQQSELRLAIWRTLRDENITIPFPQLDVHFDAPVAISPPPAPTRKPTSEPPAGAVDEAGEHPKEPKPVVAS